jgi:hypothetical protein
MQVEQSSKKTTTEFKKKKKGLKAQPTKARKKPYNKIKNLKGTAKQSLQNKKTKKNLQV